MLLSMLWYAQVKHAFEAVLKQSIYYESKQLTESVKTFPCTHALNRLVSFIQTNLKLLRVGPLAPRPQPAQLF